MASRYELTKAICLEEDGRESFSSWNLLIYPDYEGNPQDFRHYGWKDNNLKIFGKYVAEEDWSRRQENNIEVILEKAEIKTPIITTIPSARLSFAPFDAIEISDPRAVVPAELSDMLAFKQGYMEYRRELIKFKKNA